MTSVEPTKTVTGKRRHEDTVAPSADTSSVKSDAPEAKRQKKSARTARSSNHASPESSSSETSRTERAARAERRASLGPTAPSSRVKPTTRPDRKKNKKTTKSVTAAYVAEVEQKRADADATRRAILSDTGVSEALKEYEAAQAKTVRIAVLSPSPRTNVFAQRLSKIPEVEEPADGPEKPKKVSATDEDSSDSEDIYATTKYTGASQPNYFRLGSIASLEDDAEEAEAPLADFTRRLSDAALALAYTGDGQLDSNDSGTTEDIPRNPVVIASARTTGATKAQKEVYANLLGMMQRMVEDHEQTKKTTEELLLSNKLEAQRLATLIATQPPTAPPPVDSRREIEVWNRVAYEGQKYGALQAFATYTELLCGDDAAAYSKIMQPVVNAPQGDILKLLAEKRSIQPQQHPELFFSTRSLMADKLRRMPGVVMTQESMYNILKGDEERKKAAFESHYVAKVLGASKARQAYPSQYPLLNRITLEREVREKLKQPPAQTVFLKAFVANVPNAGQQIIIQQDFTERKPSWVMSDANDAEYDNARKASISRASSRASNDYTFRRGDHLVFVQPDPDRSQAQAPPEAPITAAELAPENVKICPHFLRNSCKYGDKCKMSHGAPGAPAAPEQNGPLSDKAKKLNTAIKALEWYLGKAVDMTHAELGYNDHLNKLINIIKEHTAEISSLLAFATTADILQSSFKTAVTQGLKKIMQSWWGRIANGKAMPMQLYSTIDELGQMINYANTKANYTPHFPNHGNLKVDFIPGAPRDPHQVLIQELNRQHHKNNNDPTHPESDLTTRAKYEDALWASYQKSHTPLDHALDKIISTGKYARNGSVSWVLDCIMRNACSWGDDEEPYIPFEDDDGQLDDGTSDDDQAIHPIFRPAGDPRYPTLPLLSPTSGNAQISPGKRQQVPDEYDDMLDEEFCEKVLAGMDPYTKKMPVNKPTDGNVPTAGQDGHGAGNGPGKKKICHTCGQAGHTNRYCPQNEAGVKGDNGLGGSGPTDMTCHNCGKTGHTKRDCRKGTNGQTDVTCRKCGKAGHTKRDCRKGNNGQTDVTCRICGKAGHTKRDCRQGTRGGGQRGDGGNGANVVT